MVCIVSLSANQAKYGNSTINNHILIGLQKQIPAVGKKVRQEIAERAKPYQLKLNSMQDERLKILRELENGDKNYFYPPPNHRLVKN